MTCPQLAVFALILSMGQPATTPPPPQGASQEPGRTPAASRPDAEPGKLNAPFGELFAALSDDGLRFDAAQMSGPIATHAVDPTAALLPDGRAVVIYRDVSPAARGRPRLLAITSADGGRTWERSPAPVEIGGLPHHVTSIEAPVLIASGRVGPRLIFEGIDRHAQRALYSAEFERPARFARARPLRFAQPRDMLRGPKGCAIQDGTVLIGLDAARAAQAVISTARGGRPFESPAALNLAPGVRPSALVAIDGGHRLYSSSRDGIVSARSADPALRRWSPDVGVRFPGAAACSVVRLPNRRWLMIASRVPRGETNGNRVNEGGGTDAGLASRGSGGPERDAAARNAGRDRSPSDGITAGAAPAADLPLTETPDAAAIEADAAIDMPPGTDPALPSGLSDAPTPDGIAEDAAALAEPAAAADVAIDEVPAAAAGARSMEPDAPTTDAGDVNADGVIESTLGVPIPDFKTHVDYQAWLTARHDPAAAVDNAYEHYRACMPPPGQSWGDAGFPVLINMFSVTERVGPPGPWSPSERPDWEAVFQQTRPLMAQYAEAGRHADYVTPLQFAESPDNPETSGLLFNVLLPDLSSHRALVKQALADGWRAGPDGKVDPDAMHRAIEAGLQSSRHLDNGDFLIERLVAIAQKNLVHTNARWALERGVFDAEHMERTLDTLARLDQPAADPGEWVRGEMAACLDMVQHAFGPVSPDRKPEVNVERLKSIIAYTGEETPVDPQAYAQVDPHKSARAIVNFYEEYAEIARRDYADVKPADLDALVDKHVGNNPLVMHFIPSLSRAYQLNRRAEASRRATQITYAVHLHHARTGTWPASLDDLPPAHAAIARTDPFTGHDFGYRLTERGPVLYSASENGLDDGGRHHFRWGDGSPTGEDPVDSDDHVFWPPQYRQP